MARYDPSKTFSIAARAAAKLRAVGTRDEAEVSVPLHGIPQDGMPSKSIPQASIPSDGIPPKGMPTVPLELPARGWVKAANWLFDDLPATDIINTSSPPSYPSFRNFRADFAGNGIDSSRNAGV